MHVVAIEGSEERSAFCRTVLSDLPEWFGRPDAIEEYVAKVASLPTFAVMNAQFPIGFAAVERSTDAARDIHVMGVRRDQHRRGIGRLLVRACVEHTVASGAAFLTVQTLGASHPDPHYGATRRFYEGVGFRPLMEFEDQWGEGTPMLLMALNL